MIKQTLSQKMLQKLSPQQIQLMKLLQIPTAVLEQRIKEELESNPALEEGDGAAFEEPAADMSFSEGDTFDQGGGAEEEEYGRDDFQLDDYIQQFIDEDPVSYQSSADAYAPEADKQIPVAVENDFHDYLEQQLGMLKLDNERAEIIARQIIGSIDDDGYLRRDPDSITDDLLFTRNIAVTPEEIRAVLSQIQRFDPPGLGARDLRECLLIQLEIKLAQSDAFSVYQILDIRLARDIIRDYFDEFSKKHYDKLCRQLDIEEDDLKGAIDEILKLNPKPASGYSGSDTGGNQYVIPDFLITSRDGELELNLHTKNAPDLRVSDHYRDMLRAYRSSARVGKASRKQKEAALFIKQKIDSAKWFIDAIRQRQDTLFNVMYAIMQYQYDYLLSGDEKKLKPMILKDVADITGLDISTVSRVANSKFVQTEFGVHRLKSFFSEALSTSEGEEVSTLEVKKVLKEFIDGENKRKPLSDEKLKDMLLQKSYDIARRTVAKYREQLGIPVARLRKEL
jgi:RNA polymerase sigma-54 factor